MKEKNKSPIWKMVQKAESNVAKSLIRWKHKKENIPVPDDDQLEGRSKEIAEKAHKIITERGKNVWKELKGIYVKNSGEKGDN